MRWDDVSFSNTINISPRQHSMIRAVKNDDQDPGDLQSLNVGRWNICQILELRSIFVLGSFVLELSKNQVCISWSGSSRNDTSIEKLEIMTATTFEAAVYISKFENIYGLGSELENSKVYHNIFCMR
jgi:hypothetical protein